MTENNHKEEHIADLEQATSKQVLRRIRWTGLCPGIFLPLCQADCSREGFSDSNYKCFGKSVTKTWIKLIHLRSPPPIVFSPLVIYS